MTKNSNATCGPRKKPEIWSATSAKQWSVKIHPTTGHEGPEGKYTYSSTLSLTSALDGGGWSTPRPGRFTPKKDPVGSYRRLGGPQGQSGGVRKISPPPGFDPRTIQPVASCYTDCAIPAFIVVCFRDYWLQFCRPWCRKYKAPNGEMYMASGGGRGGRGGGEEEKEENEGGRRRFIYLLIYYSG